MHGYGTSCLLLVLLSCCCLVEVVVVVVAVVVVVVVLEEYLSLWSILGSPSSRGLLLLWSPSTGLSSKQLPRVHQKNRTNPDCQCL